MSLLTELENVLNVHVTNAHDFNHVPEIRPGCSKHFTASSFTLATSGSDPTQILQLDPMRRRARITVQATASAMAAVSREGQVTSPAGSAQIAVIPASALVPGVQYQLDAWVDLTGTTASPADDDNFAINFNGLQVEHLVIDGAIVGVVQHFTVGVTAPWNGVNPATVTAIGAGTLNSIYHAVLVATPLQLYGQALLCHSKTQAVNALTGNLLADEGAIVSVPSNFDVRATGPLWAVPVNAANTPDASIIVGVLQERD